ncbi:hypothetical protein [Cetobacterium sp.]|uniref:hypothetical protein n=1 Tax=Cetobacterium sp. TaxID=2071632 RepID=UPI003EE45F75
MKKEINKLKENALKMNLTEKRLNEILRELDKVLKNQDKELLNKVIKELKIEELKIKVSKKSTN